MRISLAQISARTSVAVLAVLTLSSVAMGQANDLPAQKTQESGPFVKEGIPRMPNPPGPAPKQDLNGAWVGPQDTKRDANPEMTPAGMARFKQNHGKTAAQPWGGNDPFQYCDPLGFPRNLFAQAITSRGGTWFEKVPNQMVILYDQQRVWRDVWMDGRQLPAKVDARGFPEDRYYGYSVGHWDGDYTFVIDTTGLDPSTWLDENAHPHTPNVHIEERYTRVDQYDIHMTVTVDDPVYYTKPWNVMTSNFYWMKDQDFEENFCVPSQAVHYRDEVANPSGNAVGVK
jgi:hypothetical protein